VLEIVLSIETGSSCYGRHERQAARRPARRAKCQLNANQASIFDQDGRVGIDFGVYGVPETFVIDKRGVIRFKHIGPLTPEIVQMRIQPLLKDLDG
jgi:hypothetical protein